MSLTRSAGKSRCPRAAEAVRTPVTIVTGFLGAGKTTLVNYILQSSKERVAVIENEFGEVNVDSGLVADNVTSRQDVIPLNEGCVCCSLRKDLVLALAELDKRSKQQPCRHVLLETTGLADPGPVAFTFFTNSFISMRFRLDSVVCVVDACYSLQHIADCSDRGDGAVNEVVQQIAFADVILINKVDLVTDTELEKVRKKIRSINGVATVHVVQLTNPDRRPELSSMLDLYAFSVERAMQVDQDFLASDDDSNLEDEGHSNRTGGDEQVSCSTAVEELEDVAASSKPDKSAAARAGNGVETSDSSAQGTIEERLKQKQPRKRVKRMHDLSGVMSVGITARGPLDKYLFNMFMRDLLAARSQDIMRSKGMLCIHGLDHKKFVFQGVHATIKFGPVEGGWADDEERISKMVFIGRDLNRAELVEGFRSCVWVPLPEGWMEYEDTSSGRPYYVNQQTGQKQWNRPALQCPHVRGSEANVKQPEQLVPREQPHHHAGSGSRTQVALNV